MKSRITEAEQVCANCNNNTYKKGNPDSFHQCYCKAKKKWFPEGENLGKLNCRGENNINAWVKMEAK